MSTCHLRRAAKTVDSYIMKCIPIASEFKKLQLKMKVCKLLWLTEANANDLSIQPLYEDIQSQLDAVIGKDGTSG